MVPERAMESPVRLERDCRRREHSLEVAWFQTCGRSFKHWHEATVQTIGFGEGWNGFDSGHYMSTRLKSGTSTSEVSNLALRLKSLDLLLHIRPWVRKGGSRTYTLHAGVRCRQCRCCRRRLSQIRLPGRASSWYGVFSSCAWSVRTDGESRAEALRGST